VGGDIVNAHDEAFEGDEDSAEEEGGTDDSDSQEGSSGESDGGHHTDDEDLEAGLRIRLIRIRGFDDQKLKKISNCKKELNFF
jgi:hypothetical protein